MEASMHGWGDVRAHLSSHYRIASRDDAAVVIVWSFPNGDIEVRQAVEIRLAAAGREPWVEVSAVIAPLSAVDARRALAHSATIFGAAVATVGGAAVIRATFRLASLDLADLDRAVEAVPHEAARLRCARELDTDSGPAVFAAYSE